MSSTRQLMPPAYEPAGVEREWYRRWEEAQLFRADPASQKPHYCICVPPPNVTGELHMGHATNGTLQDIWSRYRRMTGYEVLWLPGYDHAAIATQNVIERQLAEEGTSKEEIGREAFNGRVEAWYQEIGGTIISQFRDLGASLDWSRIRFTMDAAYVRSVRTAFVRFYDKGWLYRGPRIVNWCPHNLSAISDLEVDWREHRDVLYYIRYPLDDGSGGIVIATVRPETMLADAAVAVNPNDERYKGLVGKHVILPLVGRRLQVIADDAVQADFGTGALKVTPGHDPLDYEIGERHGLERLSVISPEGRMHVPELANYDGLTVEEARARVVADLDARDFLVRSEPYVHQVGHCDRCGAVIEPLISEQWFLRMGELAERALRASEQGKVRWHPRRYERSYVDWLRGLRDWCVSRQLWLGHRIPVYTCANRHRFASVDEPSVCPDCGSGELVQDPDVLDTWFSSALWPFATLGWPDETADLSAFYANDLNSTAREIINLWVSRMIMTGLEFMGDVPFHDVAIHAVVQSADGQRMSKSKGNVLDPRVMIAKYGADALRAWCASIAMSSQDVRFDESRIEGYRRFCNKLWNATRLVLTHSGAGTAPKPAPGADLQLADRWILSRLQSATVAVTEGIEEYNFHASTQAAYDFAWGEFCDWYLEAVKPRLPDGDPAARAVALHVVERICVLLHPFMPFVTEELWHRLPGTRDFLVRESWPSADEGLRDNAAENAVARLIRVVEEIRRHKKERGAPSRGGSLQLKASLSEEEVQLIQTWGVVTVGEAARSPDASALALTEVEGWLLLEKAAGGRDRHRDTERVRSELAAVESKLANEEFRRKAPSEVVAKQEARAAELRQTLARLGG